MSDENAEPVSRSESDEEETVPPVPAKKNRSTKTWVLIKQCNSAQEAEEFVSNENTWSTNYTWETDEGQKRFYRCNKVKSEGPQCDCALHLLFVNGCNRFTQPNDVLIFKTTSEHNHDQILENVQMEINK